MFGAVGSGEANVTTAQMALVIAIVGEACFIAGFLAGTRRTTRRFREYVKRRAAHRAVQASRFASTDRSHTAEHESVLPDIAVPPGVYSLHPPAHDETRSVRR